MTVAFWMALAALTGALLGWMVAHRRGARIPSHRAVRREAAAHRLRTPLTAIKGFIELVADGEAGPVSPMQREFLATAAQNADRLEALIDDLLVSEKPSLPEGQGDRA
jgi:signal transduction histidine kinase